MNSSGEFVQEKEYAHLDRDRLTRTYRPYNVYSRTLASRRQVQGLPAIAANLRNIADEYRLTIAAQSFGLGHLRANDAFIQHTQINPSRLILLMSQSGADHLINSSMILIDGSFKSSPKGWARPSTQLLVIIGHDRGENVIDGYALMERKTQADYETVFTHMRELMTRGGTRLLPLMIRFMTDFEPAMKGALTTAFPELPQHCCIFHYSKVSTYK